MLRGGTGVSGTLWVPPAYSKQRNSFKFPTVNCPSHRIRRSRIYPECKQAFPQTRIIRLGAGTTRLCLPRLCPGSTRPPDLRLETRRLSSFLAGVCNGTLSWSNATPHLAFSIIPGHPCPGVLSSYILPQSALSGVLKSKSLSPGAASPSTCSSCSRRSPPLQKSSARTLGVEGPGRSSKLWGAAPVPRFGAQRARWNILEANLRFWVMVWFTAPPR